MYMSKGDTLVFQLPFGLKITIYEFLHERIVYDSTDECPYLDGEISRTPLRWQVTPPSIEDFDISLSEGDRRVGRMLYRTDCPTCNACEPIRVPVHLFRRSKSMRKVWNKIKTFAQYTD